MVNKINVTSFVLMAILGGCHPPQSQLRSEVQSSASPSPSPEPSPTLHNAATPLNCVVQVAVAGTVQGDIHIANTCQTLLPPDQVSFKNPQALHLTQQGHDLLVNQSCEASRMAFEQAFKLETSLHAQGYLSDRITLARQCQLRQVRFVTVGTQTQQTVQGLRIIPETSTVYQPVTGLSATQTRVMQQAHQALSQGKCEQAQRGYQQLAELPLPEVVQQLLVHQQAQVQQCLQLDRAEAEQPELVVASSSPPVLLSPAPPTSPSLLPFPSPFISPIASPVFTPVVATATPTPVTTPTGTPTPVTLPVATPAPPTLANGLGMTFVYMEPGIFTMGQEGIVGNVHQVTLTQGFYMQTTEVTQKQWWDVMGAWPGTAPSVTYGLGDNYPMYNVSFDDIQLFLVRLNTLGQGAYRLPTEAQWEYAARAGTTTRLSCEEQGGACPDDYAWYSANNTPSGTKPVATRLANPWGLFDMHGNVEEWISDKFGGGGYPAADTVDPVGAHTYDTRFVGRGGKFNSTSNQVSSATRVYKEQSLREPSLGFRLIRIQ